MKMSKADFQQWLNDHGANPPLEVDGKPGELTRKAVIQVFTNTKAPAATRADILATASTLSCAVAQVQAVALTESSGGGWDLKGLLKALWERHYFWKRIRVVIPWISNPKGGDYTTDANKNGINDSWEKLALAACRDPMAAFESASFGKFQIMGANAVAMGYANALEFAWELSRSEAAHYTSLARFVLTNKLAPAMRKISADPEDCKAFTLGYNGRLGVQRGYHVTMAGNFAKASR